MEWKKLRLLLKLHLDMFRNTLFWMWTLHSALDPGQNDFLIVLILQSTLYMSSDFSNNGGSKMFSCMRFMTGKLGTSNGIFVT